AKRFTWFCKQSGKDFLWNGAGFKPRCYVPVFVAPSDLRRAASPQECRIFLRPARGERNDPAKVATAAPALRVPSLRRAPAPPALSTPPPVLIGQASPRWRG